MERKIDFPYNISMAIRCVLIAFTGNVKKYEQMLVDLESMTEDVIKETVLEFKSYLGIVILFKFNY